MNGKHTTNNIIKNVKTLRTKRTTGTALVIFLFFSLALVLAYASFVQAQTSNLQETLAQYISDLQKNPEDNTLREKIIKLAQEMKPAPVISREAEKFGNRAEYIIINAKSRADFADAVKEYEQALLISPWVPVYYFNLGGVYEKIGQPQNAVHNFKLYLLAAPNAQDAQKVQKQIDGLEYVIENTEKIAKTEKEQLESSRVLIPAGEFMMGSPKKKDYAPQHKVFLDAYYIDKYEVTVSQYKKFCQETSRAMPPAPPWGWQDNHPIINVTWNDATAYATHYGKRLPTEAEWEKAARAGSTTNYCFGDTEANLKDYAWYDANSNKQTHPVGIKKPNAFGLYDMYGNAWEWSCDLFTLIKIPNTTKYMMRGGAWDAIGTICTSVGWWGLESSDNSANIAGFRCVSSP